MLLSSYLCFGNIFIQHMTKMKSVLLKIAGCLSVILSSCIFEEPPSQFVQIVGVDERVNTDTYLQKHDYGDHDILYTWYVHNVDILKEDGSHSWGVIPDEYYDIIKSGMKGEQECSMRITHYYTESGKRKEIEWGKVNHKTKVPHQSTE